MKNDMICVFSTTQLYEAKVIEALLANNHIHNFVLNQQDSAHGMFLPGTVQIYIPAEFEKAAKEIINAGLAELN